MSEFSKFRWNDHPVRVALKDTANALATVMFNKANMDGTKVYGSQETLAEMLGVSDRTVRRAQRQLESLGLIRRISTGSGYGRKSNEFVLTMPPDIPDTDASTQVASIPDTLPIPDTDVLHTGHGCPLIPDTGVRPIDPVLNPGNRPGFVLEEEDTSGVLPQASIFDDRPMMIGEDDLQESEPEHSVSSSGSAQIRTACSLASLPGGSSARESGYYQQHTEGGSMLDPFDPFAVSSVAHVSDDDYEAAIEAAVERHFASQQPPQPEVLVCKCGPFDGTCLSDSPEAAGKRIVHQVADERFTIPADDRRPPVGPSRYFKGNGDLETGPVWDD